MDVLPNLVSWAERHTEWFTVCGLVVAAVQALITASDPRVWLVRLPPSSDAFVVSFLFGVLMTGIAAALGLIVGEVLTNGNSGLVAGLTVGMLLNIMILLLSIGRRVFRRAGT